MYPNPNIKVGKEFRLRKEDKALSLKGQLKIQSVKYLMDSGWTEKRWKRFSFLFQKQIENKYLLEN